MWVCHLSSVPGLQRFVYGFACGHCCVHQAQRLKLFGLLGLHSVLAHHCDSCGGLNHLVVIAVSTMQRIYGCTACGQVGKAPLHVAAQTGNLDTLIKLLEAGAHRAPRDRVRFLTCSLCGV